ncbi:MAG: hypothetical protein R2695_13515, partial [Acidimicrobiales bacterium]
MSSFWTLVGVASSDQSEEDVFVWLSEQWWTPWAMLVAFSAVGFWMVRSMVLHRGRVHQIEAAARRSGMTFREEDGFALSRIEFLHMARGEGRGWTAANVVTHTGRADGASIHAFDVRPWTEYAINAGADGERTRRRHRPGRGMASDRIVRRHEGATRTAAIAPLPCHAPRLVI